ncbi:hypothetical protein DFH09DRAFT_1329420 [Mycena vulgaris]|nr:hypothetical protein DFH09DRAFT_1329420 [Mycena vulgaris]
MVTLLARASSTATAPDARGPQIPGNRSTPDGITVTRTEIRITDVAYPMKSMTPTEAEGEEIDFDTAKIGRTV